MKIHRFFVEQSLPLKGAIKIEDQDLVHQWRNVLRFQVGQEVILYDNSGSEFHAVIMTLTNRMAEIGIQNMSKGNFSPKRTVLLFLALPKRDSFEWTLEKGTELGVAAFVPVISERSEKKTVNQARSKLLLKEACEQSGRAVLPEISEPIPLAKALENLSVEAAAGAANARSEKTVHVAFDPTGDEFILSSIPSSAHINIFIGPEGGFSQNELVLFKQHNIPVCSFSSQTLRSETAAVAISSVLLLGF